MKRYFAIFLFIYLILPKHVLAHIGGGPPFLKVNGVFAQTNPYYFNDDTINIPQDVNPQGSFVVNQPVDLFIDTTQLQVPPEIAAASTFRWNFDAGSTKYEYGTHLTHQYAQPKSHIISLWVKAPGETEFLLIDTIQADILPNNEYKLPQTDISVATTKRNIAYPILFKGNATVDKSAKLATVFWGFGDGTKSTAKIVSHQYKNTVDFYTYPVIFRAVDSNGFIKDTGMIIEADKGHIKFIDATGNASKIPVTDAPTSSFRSTHLIHFIAGGIIFAVFFVLALLKKLKNKRSKIKM